MPAQLWVAVRAFDGREAAGCARVGIGARLTPHRDELVKAWTASYFLPMLKGGKELSRQERESHVEVPEEEFSADNQGVRRVPRPQKGLRLPRIFAPCKRFEHSR